MHGKVAAGSAVERSDCLSRKTTWVTAWISSLMFPDYFFEPPKKKVVLANLASSLKWYRLFFKIKRDSEIKGIDMPWSYFRIESGSFSAPFAGPLGGRQKFADHLISSLGRGATWSKTSLLGVGGLQSKFQPLIFTRILEQSWSSWWIATSLFPVLSTLLSELPSRAKPRQHLVQNCSGQL